MSQLLDPHTTVEETTSLGTETTGRATSSQSPTAPPGEAATPDSDLSSSDRRRLRQSEAYRTAQELHEAPLLSERIEIYNRRGKAIVFLAASLYPELMPLLNGEIEPLELTRADHD